MDLRDYLHYKRISIKEFAKMINYSQHTVQLVVTEKQKPGRKLVRTIEDATKGDVTRYDLLKKYPGTVERVF